MKLLCDICNSPLEMNADGQNAVCSACGLIYSAARLKEKLHIQVPVQPMEECAVYDVHDSDIEEIYDVTNYEVVDTTNDAKHFMLIVEDSFQIKGRGRVVTGYVQDASVCLGDSITIIRANGDHIDTKVAGIERFQTLLDKANPGEAVGILLSNIKEGEVARGDVITSCAAAAVKKSISDYYLQIYCCGCGAPFRINRGYQGSLPNCPNCKTALQHPRDLQ